MQVVSATIFDSYTALEGQPVLPSDGNLTSNLYSSEFIAKPRLSFKRMSWSRFTSEDVCRSLFALWSVIVG